MSSFQFPLLAVKRQSEIPPRAFGVYVAIVSLSNADGACHASLSKIASASGISKPQVVACQKALKAKGWIRTDGDTIHCVVGFREIEPVGETPAKPAALFDITPKEKPKPEKKGDMAHPAIRAYRDAAKLTPSPEVRRRIIQAIGDQPHDVKNWQAHLDRWINQNGYSSRNIAGMLESFDSLGAARNQKPQGAMERVTKEVDGVMRSGYLLPGLTGRFHNEKRSYNDMWFAWNEKTELWERQLTI